MSNKTNIFGLSETDFTIRKCQEATKIHERLKHLFKASSPGTKILDIDWNDCSENLRKSDKNSLLKSTNSKDFQKLILSSLKELDTKLDKILENQEKMLGAQLNKQIPQDSTSLSNQSFKAMSESSVNFESEFSYPFYDKLLPFSIHSAKETLSTMFAINVPINTVEEFELFDDRLTNDHALSNNINTILMELIDKNQVLTKSIVSILKTFMTKEIAMMYTAKKEVPGKKVFKKTIFYNIMSSVLINQRCLHNIDTEDKDIIKALGDVLSNACNWYSAKNKSKGQDPRDNVKQEIVFY